MRDRDRDEGEINTMRDIYRDEGDREKLQTYIKLCVTERHTDALEPSCYSSFLVAKLLYKY